MSALSSALVIPESSLVREATGILREQSGDLLFNHSVRVYLYAAEQGRRRKLLFDAALLYVAAAFHDLGLTRNGVGAAPARFVHGRRRADVRDHRQHAPWVCCWVTPSVGAPPSSASA
jgi:hypothetical protein